MPHQKFIPPVEGLDDRDSIALPDGRSPSLRNVRGDEEKISLGPGGVTFAAAPSLTSGLGFVKGTFRANTTTGNQTITHNLGATPVGVLLWTVYRSNQSSGHGQDVYHSFGMSDGTTHVTTGMAADFAPAGNAQAAATRAAVLFRVVDWTSSGTVVRQASWVSWSSTTLVINWTTVAADNVDVHYLIFGGSGIACDVVAWNATGTGNQSVTHALGATPAVGIHIHAGAGTGEPAVVSNAVVGFGAMDGTNQFAIWTETLPNSRRTRTLASDKAIYFKAALTAGSKNDASFVSWNTTSFTVNWSTFGAGSMRVYSMVLSGVSADVGLFTARRSSGDQVVTGVGFEPQALMLAGVGTVSELSATENNIADCQFSVGAATATDQGGGGIHQKSSTNPSGVRSQSASDLYVALDHSGVDARARLLTLDSDGFTLNWTDGEQTDNGNPELGYVALRFTGVSSVGTPRNVVQAQYGTTSEKTVMLTEATTFEFNGTAFVQSAEAYGGMTAVQRFMVANTQDVLAYSARGFTVGGAQTIRQYNGSAYSNLITSGTNHSANIVLAFNDRIISGDVNVGGTVNPQQIRWSISGNVNNWSGLGSGTLEIVETSNAPLTGGFVLGERCYLTKAREIIELIATGQLAPVHRQQTVISGMGLIARHSVGFGEGWVVFLGPDSIYLFDGRSIRDIGRQRISGGDHRSVMRTIAPLVDYASTDEIQGHVLAAEGEYHLRIGTDDFVYDYIRDRWFRDRQSDIAAFGVLRVGNEITTDVDASEFIVFADTSRLTWRSAPGTTTFRGAAFDAFFETKDFTAQEVVFFKSGSNVVGTLRKLNTGWSVAFMTTPSGLCTIGYSTDQGTNWDDQTVQADANGVVVRYFEAAFHLIRFRVRRVDDNPFEIRGFADYEWRESGQVLPPDLPST